jgi:ArsR family transcriptional regulator
MDAAQLFKALSDNTRLRSLALLVNYEELCVCELTHALDLPQPKVSHHLAALRKTGLVSGRKEGLWVYYRVEPQLPDWCVEVLRVTAAGLAGELPFMTDREALESMPNRPGSACCA